MKDTRRYVPESHDLAHLAPAFRHEVEGIVAEMTAAGFDPLVFETLRPPDRQWWIYGCGRTPAQCAAAGMSEAFAWPTGGIVTNAAGHLASVHGHGLATDIISKSKMWSAPEPFWTALGAAVRKRGLTWGGAWQHPHDVPHLQWSLRRRGSVYAGPSAADRARTASEGMQATWEFYRAT